MATRSFFLPLPRRKRWRIALAVGAVLIVYLVALSVIPALLHRSATPSGRREPALRTIETANWSLVPPDERENLSRAIDDAWRSLTTYRMRYVSGTLNGLAAQQYETDATSAFRLDNKGRVILQRDENFIAAESPASGGRETRFQGVRVRTNQPYINQRGKRITVAEEIYQRMPPNAWTCERVAGDREPPPAPALDLANAGDRGFVEMDGQRVRGFELSRGAFGLRTDAVVWVETATLRVRRQEIVSTLPGRREVWTYSGFGEPVEVTPPAGIPCNES